MNGFAPTESSARSGSRRQRRWLNATREKYPWLHPIVQVAVATVGVVLIVAGLAMLVLPGPGWLTVFAGFAILATEFRWARQVTRNVQAWAHRGYVWLTGRRARWAHRWKKGHRTKRRRDLANAEG